MTCFLQKRGSCCPESLPAGGASTAFKVPARPLLCAGSSWRLCGAGPVRTLNGQSGISRGPHVFQRVSQRALAQGWHRMGQNAAGESKAGSLWSCLQTSSNVPAQSRRFWYHRAVEKRSHVSRESTHLVGLPHDVSSPTTPTSK